MSNFYLLQFLSEEDFCIYFPLWNKTKKKKKKKKVKEKELCLFYLRTAYDINIIRSIFVLKLREI